MRVNSEEDDDQAAARDRAPDDWNYREWFERMGRKPNFLETPVRRLAEIPSFSFLVE